MNGETSRRLAIVFFLAVSFVVAPVHDSPAEVTGEVTAVRGRSVEIKLDGPGNPRPGDTVDLSYLTAAGAALSVGTWRARSAKGGTVTADVVDSATAPVVGLKARIYPPAKAGAKPPGKTGQPQGPVATPSPITPAAAVWLGFDIETVEGSAGGSGGILDGLQRIFGGNKGGRLGVAYVFSGSPAHNAGLRVQDIIVEVNGQPAGGPEDIARTVHQLKPGARVSFTVERAGSRIPVTMTVEPLPQFMTIGARAKAYYDKSRFAEAVREYSRAIELKSDVPQFYFYRGYCRYRLNQLDAAIADYDTALKIGPQLSWIFRERSVVFAMKKKFDDALPDMDRAIEVSRGDQASLSGLYFERARILTDLQRTDDAISDINKAVELGKTNAKAYGYRCHLFNLKRDYRQALADCNRSIDLDRNLFAAYVTRAETYEAIGNTRQALADMRQALSLRPQEKYVEENVRRLTTKVSGSR